MEIEFTDSEESQYQCTECANTPVCIAVGFLDLDKYIFLCIDCAQELQGRLNCTLPT